MGPSRTKTVKNKFAAPKVSKVQNDGVVKARKTKGTPPAKSVHASAVSTLLNRQKKKKTYTAEELGIPKLNSITPVGVVKPKGKKKGKVFVDDPESMRTILAIVQAEKEGQIESKMIKARQMEEIREARRIEAEQKEQQKRDKLEEVKDSIRKKRKRKGKTGAEEGEKENTKELSSTGTKAVKPKKKKVSFA